MLISPYTQHDETSRRYGGWRVVGVCFAMAVFGWGFGFYGHAVFLAELQRQHGWSTSLIAGATTVNYLCGAFLVAFVSDMMRRLGPRRMVLCGIAAMGAPILALPMIQSPWQLYLAYLVMSGGWAALGLGAITNILGLWFSKKRGLAISLALNGASCGGILISPALVYLTAWKGFGVATTIAVLAMVVILVPLVLAWLSAGPGAPVMTPQPDAAKPSGEWTKGRAMRSAAFWSVAAPFALAIASQVGFLVHQIAFLERSMDRRVAGLVVAVTTTMAVVGRVTVGLFIDRWDQRIAAAVSMASQALVVAIMAQTHDIPTLFVCCAVYGLSVGNLITYPALIVQREFAPAAFGMLVALTTAIAQFASGFAPALLGWVKDATGDYGSALFVCVALNAAAAVIILLRPRKAAH
ncbi:MAG: MFS transporter [Variibacter sp.]